MVGTRLHIILNNRSTTPASEVSTLLDLARVLARVPSLGFVYILPLVLPWSPRYKLTCMSLSLKFQLSFAARILTLTIDRRSLISAYWLWRRLIAVAEDDILHGNVVRHRYNVLLCYIEY